MKELKNNIEVAKNDFSNKNELYKPASFWDNATKELIEIIKEKGLEDFRNDELMSRFFVPKYGIPTNSFTKEMTSNLTDLVKTSGVKKQEFALNEFLSGYFHALSDYRVFLASNDDSKEPLLNSFSESKVGNPTEFFEFDGKRYSRSALNYILGLCFLKKHLSNGDEIKNVVEIGGGFGTLGEILSHTPGTKYVNFDILPTSIVSHYYLKNVLGETNVNEYNANSEVINFEDLTPASVLHSWQIEKMQGKIDLFVNFISFQEMEPEIVDNYLKQIKRLKPTYILLRNIREGKRIKKEGELFGVSKPMKKEDYINMLNSEYELIGENVFPFGYKTVDGYHSELTLYKRK